MRAARFLIIGCVGGIMTSRWRVVEGGRGVEGAEAAEREAERRPARHAGSAPVFSDAALTNAVQRCQRVAEEEVMRCHSAPLLSALSETLLTV